MNSQRKSKASFGPMLDVKTHVVLALEGGPRYGGELKKILAAGPRLDHFPPPCAPSNSTLYPALRKLEDDGFLEACTRRAPGQQGPPRIYYSLTGKGLRVLNQIKEVLAGLAASELAEVDPAPEAVFPIAARTGGGVLPSPSVAFP